MAVEDPDRPPTPAEVCAHLTARGLNRRKPPERLVVLDQLPRNAMGKVGKAALVRDLTADAQRGSTG